jgi:hypothetical protein
MPVFGFGHHRSPKDYNERDNLLKESSVIRQSDCVKVLSAKGAKCESLGQRPR